MRVTEELVGGERFSMDFVFGRQLSQSEIDAFSKWQSPVGITSLTWIEPGKRLRATKLAYLESSVASQLVRSTIAGALEVMVTSF